MVRWRTPWTYIPLNDYLARLCYVHNLVNERLGKSQFDCLKLDETYDCGCGPETSSTTSTARDGPRRHDDLTGVEVIKGG